MAAEPEPVRYPIEPQTPRRKRLRLQRVLEVERPTQPGDERALDPKEPEPSRWRQLWWRNLLTAERPPVPLEDAPTAYYFRLFQRWAEAKVGPLLTVSQMCSVFRCMERTVWQLRDLLEEPGERTNVLRVLTACVLFSRAMPLQQKVRYLHELYMLDTNQPQVPAMLYGCAHVATSVLLAPKEGQPGLRDLEQLVERELPPQPTADDVIKWLLAETNGSVGWFCLFCEHTDVYHMRPYDYALDALTLDRRRPVPYERLERELCPKHGLTLQNCRNLQGWEAALLRACYAQAAPVVTAGSTSDRQVSKGRGAVLDASVRSDLTGVGVDDGSKKVSCETVLAVLKKFSEKDKAPVLDDSRLMKRLEKACVMPSPKEGLDWHNLLHHICPCIRPRHARTIDWWPEWARRAHMGGWVEAAANPQDMRTGFISLIDGEMKGKLGGLQDLAKSKTLQNLQEPMSPTSPVSQSGASAITTSARFAREQRNAPSFDELVDRDKVFVEEALQVYRQTGLPFCAGIDLAVFTSITHDGLVIADSQGETSMRQVVDWYLQRNTEPPVPIPGILRARGPEDCRGPHGSALCTEVEKQLYKSREVLATTRATPVPSVKRPKAYYRHLDLVPPVGSW